MMQFEKKMLNKLIDTYENSSLSRGENKVRIRIAYAFQRKNVPEYFDESSGAYEEIHSRVKQLEEQGFLTIVWRNGKENHIIEKVLLCEEALPDICRYLNRVPKPEQEQAFLRLLSDWQEKVRTPATAAFLTRMQERVKAGKTVKEYMDLGRQGEAELLILALSKVEENTEECFIREFSIRQFHDSKRFEALLPKVCRILREELPSCENLENEELLAEYQIYHTPGYVYLKGSVCIEIQGRETDIGLFSNGIGFALEKESAGNSGISGAEQFKVKAGGEEIREVYTIENLTSFFRFQRKNCLTVYLGGYHNSKRRNLLKMIYEAFPSAHFYHFGDIDAGGFRIYQHLVLKTGIPFVMYHMDLETLKQYEVFGKSLTEHDRKRLKQLMDETENAEMRKTISYMLEHNVKLEQECCMIYPD